MEASLPLDEMTIDEKLRAMERIWDHLCRDEKLLPAPPWHRDVLAAREARLAAGSETSLDWEEAKRRIRAATAS